MSSRTVPTHPCGCVVLEIRLLNWMLWDTGSQRPSQPCGQPGQGHLLIRDKGGLTQGHTRPRAGQEQRAPSLPILSCAFVPSTPEERAASESGAGGILRVEGRVPRVSARGPSPESTSFFLRGTTSGLTVTNSSPCGPFTFCNPRSHTVSHFVLTTWKTSLLPALPSIQVVDGR